MRTVKPAERSQTIKTSETIQNNDSMCQNQKLLKWSKLVKLVQNCQIEHLPKRHCYKIKTWKKLQDTLVLIVCVHFEEVIAQSK